MASWFEIKFDKTRFEKTLDKLRDTTKNWMDKDTAKKLADTAIEEMKSLIASGTSPIRGGDVSGKFPKYLDRKKYPGKRKAATPVNLKLSGDFLDSLRSRTEPGGRHGTRAIIGFSKELSEKKESGHREGSDKAKTKKRPIIPQGRERLAVRIENKLSKILKERLSQLLKKG